MMISAVLIFIAAIANSVGDKIQFHWGTSIFAGRGWDSWANPQVSWRRKWKWSNGKPDLMLGEAFPGSSTVFVSFTDLWHLSKSIQLTSIFLACVLWVPIVNCQNQILEIGINFVIVRIIYGVTFEIFYSRVLGSRK